jgi:heme A synthase
MVNTLVLHAAAAAEKSEKVNHWIIGAVALVILLALMGILLAFAGGREHS